MTFILPVNFDMMSRQHEIQAFVCRQRLILLWQFFENTTEAVENTDTHAFALIMGKEVKEKNMWGFFKASDREGLPKGWRAQRFDEAMQYITKNSFVSLDRVLDTFPWESLGEATIVDVSLVSTY
jgi:hypothetical protein